MILTPYSAPTLIINDRFWSMCVCVGIQCTHVCCHWQSSDICDISNALSSASRRCAGVQPSPGRVGPFSHLMVVQRFNSARVFKSHSRRPIIELCQKHLMPNLPTPDS